MRNRNVGYLICGIAVVIGFVILLFNIGMKDIVSESCSHGPSCTMYDTIAIQTWLSVALAVLVLVIGLFLVFAKEDVVFKKVKDKKKRLNLDGLTGEEIKVVRLIENENGAIFQSELMEKMGMGKVKTTRILDKLESREIIERKRRGMNNIVVLNK